MRWPILVAIVARLLDRKRFPWRQSSRTANRPDLRRVKSEERHKPLEMTGTRLAAASLPTPKGFDAHPYFLGAFCPVFPQFHTSGHDSLPESQEACRCQNGNGWGFVAFGASEGLIGERVATEIFDEAGLVCPCGVDVVRFPKAQGSFANPQPQSGFRLADSEIEALLSQMFSESLGLL